MMLENVLVPVDFSVESRFLLDFCGGLPSVGVRHVVLAHIVDATGMEGPVISATVDHARVRLAEEAERLRGAGLGVEVRVTTGDAVREIVLLGSQVRAGVIAMGSHGRRVFDELLVGSVSERVMTESHVPVLLARFDLLKGAEDPATLMPDLPRKMLVPTDFSAHADRALEMAVAIAEAIPICGVDHDEPCGIVLLHAVDRSLGKDGILEAEHEASAKLAERVERAATRGVTVTPVVVVGDVAEVILSHVRDRRASGVVVGSRGVHALAEAFVGSVSKTLMREAGCLVLTVP